MSDSIKKAKTNYEKKRITKRVSFNQNDEFENLLLEFANTLEFSTWVKEKLKEEINKSGE